MLPPAYMRVIKKRGLGFWQAERRSSQNAPLLRVLIILASALLLCGCGPPGPRALLKGERLIREGKYEQAVESLQTATQLLPKNAQAYNHLGLALHGNKQFAPALIAYKKA